MMDHNDSDHDELRALDALDRAGAREIYCCDCATHVLAMPEDDECPECREDLHRCTSCGCDMFGQIEIGTDEFVCGSCAEKYGDRCKDCAVILTTRDSDPVDSEWPCLDCQYKERESRAREMTRDEFLEMRDRERREESP